MTNGTGPMPMAKDLPHESTLSKSNDKSSDSRYKTEDGDARESDSRNRRLDLSVAGVWYMDQARWAYQGAVGIRNAYVSTSTLGLYSTDGTSI